MQYPYRQMDIPNINQREGQLPSINQMPQMSLQNGFLNNNQGFEQALLNDPSMLQKFLMLKQNAANELSKKECKSCNLNLEEHIKYVDALQDAQILDAQTAQCIKESMKSKFSQNSAPAQGAFVEDDFLQARSCLGQYLSECGAELDADELEKVKAVVEQLEKEAIKRHLSQNSTDDKLNSENENAKMRLMTGSVKYKKSIPGVGKLFTREEIAKMSSDEFSKNESIINYQLENGLL